MSWDNFGHEKPNWYNIGKPIATVLILEKFLGILVELIVNDLHNRANLSYVSWRLSTNLRRQVVKLICIKRVVLTLLLHFFFFLEKYDLSPKDQLAKIHESVIDMIFIFLILIEGRFFFLEHWYK